MLERTVALLFLFTVLLAVAQLREDPSEAACEPPACDLVPGDRAVAATEDRDGDKGAKGEGVGRASEPGPASEAPAQPSPAPEPVAEPTPEPPVEPEPVPEPAPEPVQEPPAEPEPSPGPADEGTAEPPVGEPAPAEEAPPA